MIELLKLKINWFAKISFSNLLMMSIMATEFFEKLILVGIKNKNVGLKPGKDFSEDGENSNSEVLVLIANWYQ